jgi:hypothetical protein
MSTFCNSDNAERCISRRSGGPALSSCKSILRHLRYQGNRCGSETGSTDYVKELRRFPCVPALAFSLLVHTGQPPSTRLFLKKRRTSPRLPVQSRSENALAQALKVRCLPGNQQESLIARIFLERAKTDATGGGIAKIHLDFSQRKPGIELALHTSSS